MQQCTGLTELIDYYCQVEETRHTHTYAHFFFLSISCYFLNRKLSAIFSVQEKEKTKMYAHLFGGFASLLVSLLQKSKSFWFHKITF